MNPAMREYYEKRAAEYDDWWLGAGLFEQRDRPGWYEDVSALIDVLLALPPARTLDLACGTGFLTRHLPGACTASTRARRCSRSRAARCKDDDVRGGRRAGAAAGLSSGSSRRTSTGISTTAQREASWRCPRDELVVVDSALRPDGVPEDWQERVLDDGSRTPSTSAGSPAPGSRRRSAAARCCTTARGSWPSEVRARAPERRALGALAEREVRRERLAAVPGGGEPLGHAPGRA